MTRKTGVAVYKKQSQLHQRNELIERFLPLVHHVLGRLKVQLPPSLSWEDLVSAGVLGLVRAAESFKKTQDATFKTYAYIRVRGTILDELRAADPLSRSARKQLRHLWEVEEALHKELQRSPFPEELAEAMDTTIEKLDRLLVLERSVNLLSMEGPSGEDDADPDQSGFRHLLGDSQAAMPDSAALRKEQAERLAAAIKELPEKERLVLVFFYYQDLRQKEIAEILDVSPAWVSHLHARAVKRLKGLLE